MSRVRIHGKPNVGRNPLSRSRSKTSEEIAKTERSPDVGRPQVARADGADIDPLDPVGDQVAEGDRPDQVSGQDGRAPKTASELAVRIVHWSRRS